MLLGFNEAEFPDNDLVPIHGRPVFLLVEVILELPLNIKWVPLLEELIERFCPPAEDRYVKKIRFLLLFPFSEAALFLLRHSCMQDTRFVLSYYSYGIFVDDSTHAACKCHIYLLICFSYGFIVTIPSCAIREQRKKR